MSGLAESMPEARELIAGALRPVERRLSADDWFDGDPVEIATNAVLPIVADLIADAEKRSAVKATAETVMGGQRYAVVWALREAAAAWRANGLAWGDPDEEANTDLLVARKLDERADRIERGEKP